jgi:4-hydroxy-tetrahydrodipicolinate reductase
VKIAIVGYGKMGQLINAIALERNHKTIIVDPSYTKSDFASVEELQRESVDCAIEFTNPEQVLSNIRLLTEKGINQVIGTTGWYQNLPEIKSLVNTNKVGLLYAANFSLGVNAFMQIVKAASQVFNKLPEYDVATMEWHHNHKSDSPSGTALKIAEQILKNMERKTQMLQGECNRRILPEELQVSSIRCGSFPGTHEVSFDSKADTISLKHTARSREGFALGAVVAAEWLNKRQGFFEIEDLLNDMWK